MENLITLAGQLLQNQHFKIMLKDIVEDLIDKKQIQQTTKINQQRKSVQLTSVIEEIAQNIISITQGSLASSTTEWLLQITKKNQEMANQLQGQMQKILKEKIEILKQQLKDEIIKIFKREEVCSKQQRKLLVKQKRKILGESILNISNMTKKSLKVKQNHDQSLDLSVQSIFADSYCDKGQNIELLIENSELKIKNEMSQMFKNRIEINENDVKNLNKKILEVKIKVDEQIQSGFKGLWNVIANIEHEMGIIQSKYHK